MSEAAARAVLVWPALEYLPSYRRALEHGWSPDNVRGPVTARAHLGKIETDAAAFVASLVDREAASGPLTLPDGSQVARLPGYQRWLWDPAAPDGDGFCGSFGLRWPRVGVELPPHVLGHIGYSMVPWRRREGLATRGLALLLDDARAEGLAYVLLTTDPDNRASQRVIEHNGGVLVERFTKPAAFGGGDGLRWRIELAR
jgi:predicted acetyltransferase